VQIRLPVLLLLPETLEISLRAPVQVRFFERAVVKRLDGPAMPLLAAKVMPERTAWAPGERLDFLPSSMVGRREPQDPTRATFALDKATLPLESAVFS
jgi:hypothetical protein